MKAHLIGIAGKGMSAVALLLREKGWEVSGSDEGAYPPVSDYLKKAGIPFATRYHTENIPADVDTIIIGKNAKLVPESNEEVGAAFASGKRIVSFPEILHELTEHTDNLVVVGSYGKSTCAALAAWILLHSGKDPSYFIGEITRGFSAHAHVGKDPFFILEGDEYPSSNWDTTSKFLYYHARAVLLTSATHDHINVFPTHEDYFSPFKKLITSLGSQNLLVVNKGEEHAKNLSSLHQGPTVSYSLSDPGTDWQAANMIFGETSSFDLMHHNTVIEHITTKLLGKHNVENIVGVAALLLEKKLITPPEVARAVADFEGVKRRLERKDTHARIPVYEGFGSSYEKARSAIEAMRLHFPNRRLIVFFEPHTFTWRNREALAQYDTVFRTVDQVVMFSPETQGAHTHAQLSHEEIVLRVKHAGIPTTPITNKDAGLAWLQQSIQENDVVLLLTSGNMDDLPKEIPALLDRTFPR